MSSARRFVFLNNTNDNRPSVVRVQFFRNNMIYRYMVAPGAPARPIRISAPRRELAMAKIVDVPVDTTHMELSLQCESVEALTSMGVPRTQQTDQLLASIVSETKRLLAASRLPSGSTVSMWMRVLAIEPQEFEYNEYKAGRIPRADLRQQRRPNPASTTSVERSLEEVVINFNHQDARSSSGVCAVCMEEFESGVEAARTPCSHVYHRHCITKWLQESNTCPLCRRELSC
ncbi:hypothetical protein NC651_028966 [Populus alba x Populus x berolinensis]|nr:hypothetical protein NC651_028966 [Populus alba x Populus x berolinensis]